MRREAVCREFGRRNNDKNRFVFTRTVKVCKESTLPLPISTLVANSLTADTPCGESTGAMAVAQLYSRGEATLSL